MNLFSEEAGNDKIILPLSDGDVTYYPSFFSEEKTTAYFQKINSETQWREDSIKLFGKTYLQPRLTALYASNNKPYSYSGITMNPLPFTDTIAEIKNEIEQQTKTTYTTVLINLYRDGNDSNGWHSDDEKELGTNPCIASISLGTKRRFQLKHKKEKAIRFSLDLNHGSLLLMKGATQHHWKHQIPKQKLITSPRINLTFRLIK